VQKYPVRPSHRANLLPDQLRGICQNAFESAEPVEGRVLARYGAISRLLTWGEGRELAVELTMDPKVDEAIAAETIKRYNRFLEEATGYSSKERAKRLRKSAGD
jgi:hypothetical protein